ncbi:hypothetical protein [Cellulophaga sp. L1A9]|uniref:hypothetical protein n=1 Tax=Cellulophaga sp. L1A9 TaxID=2686362 RepID=UPI00131B80B3|nr:hypothetical protein [Cellulophaga sp. L1A9]
MEKSYNHNTKLQLLKRPLKKQLDCSVKHAINALKDNEKVENTTLRMNLLISNYARKAGNIIYFSNKTNFQNKKGALDLASNYFNAKWAKAFNHALVINKFYKTPNGGIVYVPKGEISYFNDDGAVYGIKVEDKEYFWDYREELYYDVYNNIYSSNGDVLIGKRSPRYVKEAYRKLMNVQVRYPNAYLSVIIGNGMPEYTISHFDASTGGVTSFGGAYYNDKAFNEEDYPEVGTGESFVPIWGSGKQAYYDFQDGAYGWGALNTGMAISDVFLIKSIYQGISKGGLRVMNKNYGSWSSYRRFYGKNGFAKKEQHLHHWLLERNGAKNGSGLGWKAKNQMWNLNPLPEKFFEAGYDWNQIHRAIEGKTSPLYLNSLERFHYGTPNYLYPLGIYGFRGLNQTRD